MEKSAVLMLAAIFIAGCAVQTNQEVTMADTVSNESLEKATFAGGCFWCMEPPFEKLDGVHEVISGYTGGEEENPSYKKVSSGTTGHVEAVQVMYDPEKITYEELLDVFWRQIDPTDSGGQFVDRGGQYTTAIFYHDEEQKVLAEESKEKFDNSGIFQGPIMTPIKPSTTFYRAEEYHQDYYKKSKVRYEFYRRGSGRDNYLDDVWGEDRTAQLEEEEEEMEGEFVKPSDEELKKMLSPMQYKVTQEDGTEPAFDNEYWNNTEEGIYVDIVSGEPLFSSKDKYKSGTGWPSFTKPLEEDNIVLKRDFRIIIPRTEVRSKQGVSHLGHVFNDGPEPTGKRYCMNSAALRFIPWDKLEEEGYGKYLELFSE